MERISSQHHSQLGSHGKQLLETCNAWSLRALVPHQQAPGVPGRAGGSPQPAQSQHQGHCSQKDV